MKLFEKLKQILSIKLPNWAGIICYTILIVSILLSIVILILNYFFPEKLVELIDLIIEYNVDF